MKSPLKFILWILPALGIVMGYAYAYVFFHGLLETWHNVGKPDENIVRILGIREARNLLVETESGKTYSFEYGKVFLNAYNIYEGEVALPPQPVWKKEEFDTADPRYHFEYYGADFFTLPPLFRVEQLIERTYLYRVEGKGEVKFALAADGNLWMWNHQIAGLTGLVFYYYPVMGFLAGLTIVLIVIGVQWLKGKNRLLRQRSTVKNQPERD
jgi:hypothetical protein